MSVQHYGGVLSATVLFGVASAAYKRIQPEDSTQDLNSINCDSLVPIVFSAAAIEAFFNELPGLLSMFPELLHLEPSQISIYVQQAKELVNKRDHTGSTGNKYLLAYCILSGRDCNKGDSPYQDFASLFAVRDGILHAKSTTFSGKADPDGKLDMVVSEELPGH
jgi:hypothetical protein